MRNSIRRAFVGGVITVYLALILLLILSLVVTIIEGARISTAKVYATRALSTAMDSVWAEYYEPLWKEYHLFGYSAGTGSEKDKAEKIGDKITEYISYTLSPNAETDSRNNRRSVDLYDIRISSLTVTDQTRLLDYKGELFRKEAVEYMKYHEVAEGLSLLLEKLNMLETPKKVSAVYDKKLAAELEMAKADKNILRLMELLDGIKTSKNGIKLDGEGKLQATDYYAKMLCSTPISMETVGINHIAVFEAVKNRYINPADSLIQVKIEIEQLTSLKEQLNNLKEDLSAAYLSLEEIKSQRRNVPRTKDKSTNQQREEMDQEINSLQEQIDELHSQEQQLLTRKEQLTSSVNDRLERMNHILRRLIPITEEAEYEAEQVMSNVDASAELIDEFEENLFQEKENLGAEIFKGLEERLKEMKQYSSSYDGEETFYDMYDSLGMNRLILREGEKAIQKTLTYLKEEDYPVALNYSLSAQAALQHYQIENLTIDYSTLVLDSERQKNPIKEVGKLLQSGITSLIIDPSSISDKEMTVDQLPSLEASLTVNGMDFASMITAFFEDSLAGNDQHEMGNLLYDFQHTTELSEGIEKGINLITENLLFQEYLKEHFDHYPVGNTQQSDGKPQVLHYEQEYLLEGYRSDQGNLAAVISRIVFIRMILDFVTLLGDKTRCEEAKLAAAAMVGFSGLPMLINITQAVLLMVWSFTEALVDTCALLLGKEVPILKHKLSLQFPEMFLLNRSFIRTKAETYAASEQLSFSYQDYLRIFMLMKHKRALIWRAMDLIQENLNLRYEEKIFLRDSLFGIEASVDYTIDTRFIAVPFLRNYIHHNLIGYEFSSKAAYCY